jgi:hypothetical protein
MFTGLVSNWLRFSLFQLHIVCERIIGSASKVYTRIVVTEPVIRYAPSVP